MVRKRDEFWQYVEIAKGVRSCKFCKQDFSGVISISRIKSHLAGVSGRDVKLCAEVSEDVKLLALDAINIHASKKKAKSTKSLENVEETESVSCPSSSLMKGVAAHQSNLPNICNKEDKSAVDDKLVKFIISNDVSLDVIQSSSFIDFMKSVSKFGPSYELPSRLSIITKLIQIKLEEEISKFVASVKKSFAVTGCTLMYYSTHAFKYIFACTPRGMVVIESLKYSSEEIVDVECLLSHTIETLGPEHVTQVISLEHPKRLFMCPQTVMSTCASYQIKHLLEKIYYDNEWVNDIIRIARTIVAYIHKHNVNLLLRRDHIRSKKVALLHHNVFFEFHLLCLILQVENELQALQLPISSLSCTWCDFWSEDDGTQHAKYVQALNGIIHNNDFWRGVREVVQVLQPIFEVLHLVEDYRSTSGYLYEAWERATDKFKECMGKNPEKYEPIWQKFKRCQIDLIRPIYKAAAFLNPDYMLSENFMEDIEITKGVNYVVDNLVALEDKEAFVNQIQRYRSKEPCTFTTTSMTMLRTTHPGKWWECCGDHLPVLQKYAIRILSQPCSLFSCEQHSEELRGSDNPILRVNKRLMEEYSILGAQDEEPIDLDKLSEFLAHVTNYFDIEEYKDDIDDGWETFLSERLYEDIMERWS